MSTLDRVPQMRIKIRSENDRDEQSLWNVNKEAFGGEEEARLVNALRQGGYVAESLVAELDEQVVGHILFSRITIRTEFDTFQALSLAPMAVLPNFQRRGIGSRLVEAGLAACQERGHTTVLVLGHPNFYPRFGFSSDLARRLKSPFGGGEAWMAIELSPGALSNIEGLVEYSPPFCTLGTGG